MHILVLPSWYPTRHGPVGGVFFKEQAEAVAAAGHRVGVIYPDLRSLKTLGRGGLRSRAGHGLEGGLCVYRASGWRLPKLHGVNARRWIAAARRLYRAYAADNGPPDLIHAHSAIWAGVAAARLSREFAVPYILTEHSTGFARGLYEGWYRPHLEEAFASARTVVAVSEPFRCLLARYRPAEDIRVIPNAVDTEFFTLPPSPRDGESFRFISIAILSPKKAIDKLLEAFAAAFRGRREIGLDIVGDGPERSRLQRLARRFDLESQVVFHGMLDRRGVRERLWQAHCCVSSSRVETFGVTLIEAMATGIPVIATRSGGPEGFVSPDCGYLVPVDDVPALAAAMREAYEKREDWRAATERLHGLAVRNYGASNLAARLGKIYAEISEG